MPLLVLEHFGTCEDGSASREYCCYCYQKGAFTEDCTMGEMIDHCLLHLDEFNKGNGTRLTPEEARDGMERFFPTLKRWSKEQKSAFGGKTPGEERGAALSSPTEPQLVAVSLSV